MTQTSLNDLGVSAFVGSTFWLVVKGNLKEQTHFFAGPLKMPHPIDFAPVYGQRVKHCDWYCVIPLSAQRVAPLGTY